MPTTQYNNASDAAWSCELRRTMAPPDGSGPKPDHATRQTLKQRHSVIPKRWSMARVLVIAQLLKRLQLKYVKVQVADEYVEV